MDRTRQPVESKGFLIRLSRSMPRSFSGWAMALLVLASGGLVAGCGSSFAEILFQAASAAGRSALDIALTDLANDLADAAEEPIDDDGDPETTDDDSDGGGPGDDGGGSGDGGMGDNGGGDLTGDAVAGEAVFAANGCGSCHCPDASGGCALSAPGLAGTAATVIESFLSGAVSHPIQVALTAQELTDLEAYFASLGG